MRKRSHNWAPKKIKSNEEFAYLKQEVVDYTSSSLRIESSWIRFILSIAQNSLTLVIDWTSAIIIKLGPDNYLFPSLSLPVPIYTDLHKYNVGTYI